MSDIINKALLKECFEKAKEIKVNSDLDAAFILYEYLTNYKEKCFIEPINPKVDKTAQKIKNEYYNNYFIYKADDLERGYRVYYTKDNIFYASFHGWFRLNGVKQNVKNYTNVINHILEDHNITSINNGIVKILNSSFLAREFAIDRNKTLLLSLKGFTKVLELFVEKFEDCNGKMFSLEHEKQASQSLVSFYYNTKLVDFENNI